MKLFFFFIIILLPKYAHCTSLVQEIALGDSVFSSVARSSAFVDRSLLLKWISQEHGPYFLFLAPPRSGKSTNLSMLKHFVSHQLPFETLAGKERRREMFEKLKIGSYPETMKDFGAYPTMYVDFQTNSTILDAKGAFGILAEQMHKAFLEHEYLKTSKHLSESQKKQVEDWCNGGGYTKVNNAVVQEGLDKLAQFLSLHHGKQAYLLVDGFDAMTNSALDIEMNKGQLNSTSRVVAGIIESFLKRTLSSVQAAFMTGVTFSMGNMRYGLDNVKYVHCMQDSALAQFYGFTQSEVDSLFKRFSVSDVDARLAREWYDGYVCKDSQHLYNTYSIVNFLAKRKLVRYWAKSSLMKNFHNGLHVYKTKIEKMLLGKPITVAIQNIFKLDDLHLFQKVLTNDITELSVDNSEIRIFFNVLLQNGCLTIDWNLTLTENVQRYDYVYVKIPNNELKEFFNEELKMSENKQH